MTSKVNLRKGNLRWILACSCQRAGIVRRKFLSRLPLSSCLSLRSAVQRNLFPMSAGSSVWRSPLSILGSFESSFSSNKAASSDSQTFSTASPQSSCGSTLSYFTLYSPSSSSLDSSVLSYPGSTSSSLTSSPKQPSSNSQRSNPIFGDH